MRRFIYAAFTMVILLVLLIGGMYVYIEWYGRNCEPEKADAIIVLGAAVWRDGPSPALLERINLAETLYRHGYAPAIITTAGIGTSNPIPEGRAARDELIRRGISGDTVYEETHLF
ncbi:YdcF family protein [Biomaibacter acetigenes]|uniref:YdcF family protein n=2 Tax=Biomaibacter acetigenes TaxID=2316383 RepID=A0A3G2R7T3_9FIRM|nr:YdcF family protein [Biomaibacter acetigenes]